jgi:hypothetical protein
MLGADDYSLPKYWGSKHFSYFRTNNHGQSTLTPGDELQNSKAVAPIVAFGTSPELGFAVADLTLAYPNEAQKILRGVAMLKRSRVLVQDELTQAQAGVPLHWAMITSSQIALAPDGTAATLTQGKRTLHVEALLPGNARFRIASTKPPTTIENQNQGTVMLLLDVPAPTLPSDVRIAVMLTPIGDRWPVLPTPDIVALTKWH